MLESRFYTPAPNSAMPDIAIATAVSFAIGAIPAAYLIGKLNGINVFEVGTKQAGATNILKTVNRRAGLIVFVLDAGKGVATIYISQTVFNIDISWLWLPSAATVMGHWNSPLTKFRGGDGVASLFGVTAGTFGLAFLLPTLAIGCNHVHRPLLPRTSFILGRYRRTHIARNRPSPHRRPIHPR